MKKYLLLFVVALALLSGCATPYSSQNKIKPEAKIKQSLPKLVNVKPKFEDSNQNLMEKVIDSIGIGAILKTEIPNGSKVALISVETNDSRVVNKPDKALISLLEDQLINSLVASDIIVVERDADILANLIRERIKDNKYSFTHNQWEDVIYSKYYDEKECIVSKDSLATSSSEEGFLLYETHLPPIDYLISYRILEAGILYFESNKADGLISREGLVKLNVRVQNTITGEIIFSDNLQGRKENNIPNREEVVKELSSFHYMFFSHEYPLQNNTIDEKIIQKRSYRKYEHDDE